MDFKQYPRNHTIASCFIDIDLVHYRTMNLLSLKALSLNCTSTKSRKTMFYQIFLKGFQLFVIVFMIYIFYQCICRYCEQADNSTVDYQWYHQHEKDIYPTISACFSGSSVVFSEEKIKLLDSSLNAKLYSQFLEGKYWDDRCQRLNTTRFQ